MAAAAVPADQSPTIMTTPTTPGGNTFLLFVYGTLKRGGVRHHVLADQIFLGEVRTRPSYNLFDFTEHPALVRCISEARRIRGEMYRVATSLLGVLDEIEDAPQLFRLEPIQIEDMSEPVFAYLYQGPTQGRPVCVEDSWTNP
jgi:gamma-glutamylcyclotransferase (GGCT)/AIG2-like uncharacterized protein YtfP